MAGLPRWQPSAPCVACRGPGRAAAAVPTHPPRPSRSSCAAHRALAACRRDQRDGLTSSLRAGGMLPNGGSLGVSQMGGPTSSELLPSMAMPGVSTSYSGLSFHAVKGWPACRALAGPAPPCCGRRGCALPSPTHPTPWVPYSFGVPLPPSTPSLSPHCAGAVHSPPTPPNSSPSHPETGCLQQLPASAWVGGPSPLSCCLPLHVCSPLFLAPSVLCAQPRPHNL